MREAKKKDEELAKRKYEVEIRIGLDKKFLKLMKEKNFSLFGKL